MQVISREHRSESKSMGKNKTQQAAEERATKKSTPAPAAEQPKAAEPKAVAATQPATPNKQQLTIDKLTAAFKEQRQIEIKPSMLVQDGKFINVMLGKGWPTIRVGNSGGITVMELKSYTSAFEAAIDGDKRLAKQTEREQKKAAAAAPVKAAAPDASPAVKAKAA